MLRVRVLFFSLLQDITGTPELLVVQPSGVTLQALLESLFTRWPRLREWDESLLLAIDHDYAARSALLRDGCEVAIMPPVQGG